MISIRGWCLLVLLATSCAAYNSIFFLKFHKVGGTTAAIKLIEVAESHLGYEESCRGGEKVICAEHTSLNITRNTSLAPKPIGRIHAKFLNPLKLVLVRHPIDKLFSQIYYYVALGKVQVTDDERMLQVVDRMWSLEQEYLRTLGVGETGVPTYQQAIQALENFHVVGLTDEMPEFFAMVAHLLKLPVLDFAYKSAKVDMGRPTFDSQTRKVKDEVHRLLAETKYDEVYFYEHAEKLARSRVKEWDLAGDVTTLRNRLEEMNDGVECDTDRHESAGVDLKGKWCYDFRERTAKTREILTNFAARKSRGKANSTDTFNEVRELI